jgi:hypothetical protein
VFGGEKVIPARQRDARNGARENDQLTQSEVARNGTVDSKVAFSRSEADAVHSKRAHVSLNRSRSWTHRIFA